MLSYCQNRTVIIFTMGNIKDLQEDGQNCLTKDIHTLNHKYVKNVFCKFKETGYTSNKTKLIDMF